MVESNRLNMPAAGRRQARRRRRGNVLVFVVCALPMLLAVLGLVVDGGLMMSKHRHLQAVADSAATAAARELANGNGDSAAVAAAEAVVRDLHGLATASVVVNRPPAAGPYAGKPDFVEVFVTSDVDPDFVLAAFGGGPRQITTRAVAGNETSTAGGAVVVLDPDPPGITITGLPLTLPPLPPLHLGGLELLGLGRLTVQGAVLVNNEWGDRDEHDDPAGRAAGPPYACSCMPILPLTKLRAEDIRVVGGVDNPANYGHVNPADSSPLQANKAPMPDPLKSLPVPTTFAHMETVKDSYWFAGNNSPGACTRVNRV